MSGEAIDHFQKQMVGEIVSILAARMVDDDKTLLTPALNYLRRCIAEDDPQFKGMYLKLNGGNPTVVIEITQPGVGNAVLGGVPVPIIDMIVGALGGDAPHHKWKFYSEFTQQLRDALGLKDSA